MKSSLLVKTLVAGLAATSLMVPLSVSAHGGGGWGWGFATGAILGAELAYPHYYYPYGYPYGGYYAPYYPPAVIVTQPPVAPATSYVAPSEEGVGYWYYCESSKSYYPYVSQCPEAWKKVPAAPPPAPPAPH
jgi:hypothetical protein